MGHDRFLARRIVKPMKYPFVFVIAIVIAALMASCGGSSPRYTRNSLGTDYLFSVDQRGNGAYGVWFRNDSIAVYCTTNTDFYNGIKTMMETYPGVPVKFNYHGDGSPVSSSPCANIESSSTVSATFELDDIS